MGATIWWVPLWQIRHVPFLKSCYAWHTIVYWSNQLLIRWSHRSRMRTHGQLCWSLHHKVRNVLERDSADINLGSLYTNLGPLLDLHWYAILAWCCSEYPRSAGFKEIPRRKHNLMHTSFLWPADRWSTPACSWWHLWRFGMTRLYRKPLNTFNSSCLCGHENPHKCRAPPLVCPADGSIASQSGHMVFAISAGVLPGWLDLSRSTINRSGHPNFTPIVQFADVGSHHLSHCLVERFSATLPARADCLLNKAHAAMAKMLLVSAVWSDLLIKPDWAWQPTNGMSVPLHAIIWCGMTLPLISWEYGVMSYQCLMPATSLGSTKNGPLETLNRRAVQSRNGSVLHI